MERIGMLVFMNTWFQHNARRIDKARLLLAPAVRNMSGCWADLGCGDGVFTYLLFDLLQSDSVVYGVDERKSALQRLRQNLAEYVPADRLHLVQADFIHPLSLPPLQGMVLANSLHFVRHKAPILRQLVDLLEPGGRIVVIEYNTNRGNTAVPYPLDEIEFLNLAREAGLQQPQIVTKVPSSFLGEMYAGMASKNGDIQDGP